MFCRNCGSEMHPDAVICVKCGVPKEKGNQFCPNCGKAVAPEAVICVSCGASLSTTSSTSERKSKLVAGLLGIFLGVFGVHNFYLGFTQKAVIQLILGIFSCGISSIWGFIEGIMILCQDNPVDAAGNPLDK